MAEQGATGLRRLILATGYSLAGLRAAFRFEAAFRQELLLVLIGLPLALRFGHSGVERAILSASLLLVLIVELLNSGIEAAIDRFGAQQHPLSARAKDFGSAAVMLSLVNAAVVWALILFT